MKKLFTLLFTVTTLFMFFAVAYAGQSEPSPFYRSYLTKKCGVIVGSPELTTDDFINIASEKMNSDGQKKSFAINSDMQNKYQEFWFGKGVINADSAPLTPETMREFVNYADYDQCLFIIPQILDENTANRGASVSWWGGFANISSKQKTRTTVTVKGLLVNRDGILKLFNATKDDYSKASALRARRGAFGACMGSIGRQYQEYNGQKRG